MPETTQAQRWYIARMQAATMLPSLDSISVLVYTMHRNGEQVLTEGKPEYHVFVDGGFCSTGVEEFVCADRDVALEFAKQELCIFLREYDE